MWGSIAKRWRLLSGQKKWKGLLDPLDKDLRHYLLHYGDMAQATYDAFNTQRKSKYAGDCHYSKKNLFSQVGLVKNNPFRYTVTKYLYATSQIKLPMCFLLHSISREAWNKESNWMGYVAVATDQAKARLGRRDIVVAWRGSIQALEWATDFDFPLVEASEVFPRVPAPPRVGSGWLSLYTTASPRSPFNKTSAREQVTSEVKRLLKKYRDEEVSITITGHSLGALLGTLNGADIAANGYNEIKSRPGKPCPVTVFNFASPRAGDQSFKDLADSLQNLHILRIRNLPDIAPLYPLIAYSDVGVELSINTLDSEYLKKTKDLWNFHNMEVYLHGVAGTQGSKGGFKLEVKRDLALVNKDLDFLEDEYLVPKCWWTLKHKGMVQRANGSWRLDDHER